MGGGGITDENNLVKQMSSRYEKLVASVRSRVRPDEKDLAPLAEPSAECLKKMKSVAALLITIKDSADPLNNTIEVYGHVDPEVLDCIRALFPGAGITASQRSVSMLRDDLDHVATLTTLTVCLKAVDVPEEMEIADASKLWSLRCGWYNFVRVPREKYDTGYVALGPNRDVFKTETHNLEKCTVAVPHHALFRLHAKDGDKVAFCRATRPARTVVSAKAKLVHAYWMHAPPTLQPPHIPLSQMIRTDLFLDNTTGMVLSAGRTFSFRPPPCEYVFEVVSLELDNVPGNTDTFGVVTNQTRFTEVE